jgi:hypothetical protein
MGNDNLKQEKQCAIHDVINSFNTFIATVIGGTIGLTVGIIGIVILNCL